MRLRCLTCGGTYSPVLPDGMQYFHVCPPLSLPELTKAVADRRVVLKEGETVEDVHSRRIYDRTAKRDERIVPPVDGKGAASIVSAGRGVEVLDPSSEDIGVIVVPD